MTYRETSALSVVQYTVRVWPDNPKRHPKESKVSERRMSPAQQKLWESLCDPLTTDEPLRLAMLDAALRVKYEHTERVVKSLGLSDESEAAITQVMSKHREQMLTGDYYD